MIYIPKICPIRITQIVVGQNLSQDFNQTFKGINYPDNCSKWLSGEELTFQFYSTKAISSISTTANGATTGVSVSDITPSGWAGLGSYVYEVTYTPSDDSLIFEINDGESFFKSDIIQIVTESEQLIKIEYSNSENDYGYVGTSTLTTYQRGEFRSIVLGNEKTVFDNDRGELTMLRATPTEGYQLNIYDVDYSVANLMNLIWSCDDVELNGEPFQAAEAPEAEPIEMSNLFNIQVNIQRVDEDYEFFNTTADGIELITDNTDEITTDNEYEINY